jgi:hypothetical protein
MFEKAFHPKHKVFTPPEAESSFMTPRHEIIKEKPASDVQATKESKNLL